MYLLVLALTLLQILLSSIAIRKPWVMSFFILLELCKRKDYDGFSKEKIGSGSTTKQKYEKMYVVPSIVQNILTKIHTKFVAPLITLTVL